MPGDSLLDFERGGGSYQYDLFYCINKKYNKWFPIMEDATFLFYRSFNTSFYTSSMWSMHLVSDNSKKIMVGICESQAAKIATDCNRGCHGLNNR